MEIRPEHDRTVVHERREVLTPVDVRAAVVPLVGPRVRWGGVTSGVVMALGVVLLLTT